MRRVREELRGELKRLGWGEKDLVSEKRLNGQKAEKIVKNDRMFGVSPMTIWWDTGPTKHRAAEVRFWFVSFGLLRDTEPN